MTRASIGVCGAVAAIAMIAVPAAEAAPGGVAYVKDGQVWVANLDGSHKVKLSEPPDWYNEVGQAADGAVVATKNEPGKIFSLSQFSIWTPTGALRDSGPAGGGFGGASLAMPLGLDLTLPNGSGDRAIVAGYSAMTYSYPVSNLELGYTIIPSATRVSPVTAVKFNGARWPSLAAGDRVIGTPDEKVVAFQDGGGIGSQNFTPWIDFSGLAGYDVNESHVSDDGRLVVTHVSTNSEDKVIVAATAGLGGAVLDDGGVSRACALPATGKATAADVSADGNTIVWADDDGVKVAAPPSFGGGGEVCALPGAPRLIDGGVKHVAIGAIDVDAIWAARNPSSGGGGGGAGGSGGGGGGGAGGGGGGASAGRSAPTVAAPAAATVRKLLSGKAVALTITTPAAGRVTVRVTVAPKLVKRRGKTPIVVASGQATARKAGRITVRVRATKQGRALRRKLRGKHATVTATVGKKRGARTITLR